jgi:2'-5' RNA ligase
MELIRSFVAIELPRQVEGALGEMQQALKAAGITDQVRWVRPEGMHLTLKFLGDVPATKTDEIALAVAQASCEVHPFSIRIAGLGCFPSLSHPNVVWVGVQGDTEELTTLQQNIENRLSALGYPPEGRTYTPHLTLGRVARNATGGQRRRLGEVIGAHEFEPSADMQVREVALMRSDLSPSGARYTELALVPLKE